MGYYTKKPTFVPDPHFLKVCYTRIYYDREIDINKTSRIGVEQAW